MEIKIPKPLIKVTGDITLSPYPMFIRYKPHHYSIRGEEVELIANTLKVGDILLRRYFEYLNTMLTPGYWGHAGLYIGNNQVIHAIGKGVTKEHLFNFCRTDSFCSRRILADDPLAVADRAVHFAEKCLGKDYDFGFDIGDDKYSCAELINACYKPLFVNDYEKVFGKLTISWKKLAFSQTVITPAGIYRSKAAETILEIRDGRIIGLDTL